MNDEIKKNLQDAYDRSAVERDRSTLQPWKAAVRQNFLELLHSKEAQTLLEIGSGPGREGLYFKERGLDVTCIDLSPAMIELCRAKGLKAEVMDMAALDFPAATFDAVFALNSLLHLPKIELPGVLEKIKTVLRPGGLFYLGVYGGRADEGIWSEDAHDPPRFFSFYTDDEIERIVRGYFELLSFEKIVVNRGDTSLHHQSMILKN